MEIWINTSNGDHYVDIGDDVIKLALVEPNVWHCTSGITWVYAKRFVWLRVMKHRLLKFLRRNK
jgi:hypothetical protein